MPLQPIFEDYNGFNTVYQNAGDWFDVTIRFDTRFSISSSQEQTITYGSIGVGGVLNLSTGDWGDFGFLAGDPITITYSALISIPGGTTWVPTTITNTVDYVDNNLLYLVNPIAGVSSGTVFPTDGVVSTMFVVADKMPDSIEYFFNLTPNGGSNLGSVLDSSFNRFEIQNVPSMLVGTPQPLTQLGNKSGGYITDANIEYLGVPGNYFRRFEVTFKCWQWGIIQSGFSEPDYYDAADHLAPISRIKAFSQYGNPNGVNIANTTNTEANTGGYDENYNGGTNQYSVKSISWVDALGNAISALDYSGNSTFTAVLDAPGQNDPNSTYRLGLAWRPIDDTVYQSLPEAVVNNLMVIAPENDFIADGVTDATVYAGFDSPGLPGVTGSAGAQWDLTNVNIEITGVDEITIIGEIQPNTAARTLFDNVPDGGRKSTLWVSIGNYLKDGTLTSERVSLKLFDEDNIDAPTVGVQIPDVLTETFLDHGLIDIFTPEPQTTTEDDVLYKSEFLLIDNVDYEGIRAQISAYNTVTGEEFVLENFNFSFATVPNIAGQFQPNFQQNRGFNLPPTTDRNWISVKRKPSLDVAGKYGIELQYGYLSDWRYWLEQSNVDNDFFDITEEFDGKNKNWQRFYSGNWKLRLSYFTQVAGVEDFNHYEIGVRPYEDDVTVSTAVTIEVLSTGATPTAFVADELHEVTWVFTWSAGAFSNEWVEITCEDFEGGNRWVMSTEHDQGGIAANPLKPISGVTIISVTGSGTNTLTCKALVDTNVIGSNKISLSYRVYSEDPEFIVDEYDPLISYSVRKVSGTYTGPLVKLRRSIDDAEEDFYPDATGWLTLDSENLSGSTNLGTWAQEGFSYVVIWYDQSGNGYDVTMATKSRQPRITNQGGLEVVNGKAAPYFISGDTLEYTAGPIFGNGPITVTGVWENDLTTTGALFDVTDAVSFGSSSGGFRCDRVSSNMRLGTHITGSSSFLQYASASTTQEVVSFLHDTTNRYLRIDNVQVATDTQSGNVQMGSTTTHALGSYAGSGGSGALQGHIQELHAWNTNQTANIAAIEDNMNGGFTVY